MTRPNASTGKTFSLPFEAASSGSSSLSFLDRVLTYVWDAADSL